MKHLIYLITIGILFTACKQNPENMAESIYFGGDIITMEGEEAEYVEALAVKDGKIQFVGTKEEAMKLAGDSTQLIDMEGKTMLPGFIDPHSHVVMQSAKFGCVNLDPYPIGDVKNITDIQRKLRERIDEKKPAPGTTIVGWGYDDTGLEEMRHPNRDDLDAVSTEYPIILIHISSHLMACNSKALELAGITASTPDPEGGKFQRRPGSNEPLGVMEELAMFALGKVLPTPGKEESVALLEEGLKKYAAEGITTCHDAATLPGALKLLQFMDSEGKLPIDLISFPLYKSISDSMVNEMAANFKNESALSVKGIKLILDGSIQGYTAYLSEPYYTLPNSQKEIEEEHCTNEIGEQLITGDTEYGSHHTKSEADLNDYRGYAGMTQEEVETWVQKADKNGLQIQAHCNGDAAIDMLIDALKKVRGDNPRPDLRTTIIHSQVIREEQIDYAAQNGIILSFFPIHVEFWGDRHRDLFLGQERAERIDPANTALKKGVTITLHHDAPIAHWGMLPVISSAVNRLTTSGKLLGADERITPYQAICAVTKNAAFQSSEENRKGTLKSGKLADLVILDKNPLKIDPTEIKKIQVLETIKEGETVFSKN